MNAMKLGKSVCTGVLLACVLSHPQTAMGNNGDYDFNGVVDQDDFAHWGECMTGPDGVPIAPYSPCSAFDFDGNSYVDMHDFGMFSAAYNTAAVPLCHRAGFSRLYAGAGYGTSSGPPSYQPLAVGLSADISAPHHPMRICGEPFMPETVGGSRVYVGLSRVLDHSEPPPWIPDSSIQLGYARRRFEPWGQPPLYLEGLNAETDVPGHFEKVFGNLNNGSGIGNFWAEPTGNHPFYLSLPPEQGDPGTDEPPFMCHEPSYDGFFSYWSFKSGTDGTWYFKVGCSWADAETAILFHSTQHESIHNWAATSAHLSIETNYPATDVIGKSSEHARIKDMALKRLPSNAWLPWPIEFGVLHTGGDKHPQAGQIIVDGVLEIWDTDLIP